MNKSIFQNFFLLPTRSVKLNKVILHQSLFLIRGAQRFQEFVNYSNNPKNMYYQTKRKDFYAVLNLDQNASKEQIKRMYKKLAVRWHPDKNLDNKENAKQKFREIAEAYEILSDDHKRKQYDGYGFANRKARYGHKYNHEDADNLFKKFFMDSGFETAQDDEFFNAFSKRRTHTSRRKSGFESMFDDDKFWTSGLSTRMPGFSPRNMASPGKIKRTVNTIKEIINGKIITTKITTIERSDGTKRITEQKIDEEGRRISFKTYEKDNSNNTRVSNK